MKKLLFPFAALITLIIVFIFNGCKKDAKDTTNPTITLNGPAFTYWKVNHQYADYGCTANDETDGTIAVTTSGTVNPGVPSTYNIDYTAKDAAGNKASTSRSVRVVNFDSLYDLVHTGCTDTSRNTIPGHPDSSIVHANNLPGYYDLTITNFARRAGNTVNAYFSGSSIIIPQQQSPIFPSGDLVEGTGSISGTGIGSSKMRLTIHFKESFLTISADSVIQGNATYTHR